MANELKIISQSEAQDQSPLCSLEFKTSDKLPSFSNRVSEISGKSNKQTSRQHLSFLIELKAK